MAFLSFQNKAHFRFFYETQDVKVIFLRNTGSKFYETQDIINTFNKDKYNNKDPQAVFFLVYATNKQLLQKLQKN